METNEKGAKVSLNSIVSLFGDTFSFYQERFTVLMEIVLLPVLLIVLGYILMWLGFPFSILGALILFVGYIALAFGSLALIFSIHHNTDVDASYRGIIKFFWPLVWISIISFFAFIGGAVMLIIPAIWLTIAMALRSYALVIENRRGLDALRQSKEYIKGYWWAVLGRTILMVILFWVIALIIEVPFGLIGGRVFGNVGSGIILLFVLPFSSIFYYKIYQNLRSLKPHLVDASHTGRGFIKVSAIVGIVASVVVIVIGIVAVSIAFRDCRNDMSQCFPASDNSWQYPTSNQQ